MPGEYEFVAKAPGYGHVRFRATFAAGQTRTVTISMPTNRASVTTGASAGGNGAPHNELIDDTEGTTWECAPSSTPRPIGQAVGSQVAVDLQGTAPQHVNRMQVSAMLLPGQNRFTALRRFRIDVSTNGTTFRRVFTSSPEAFPGVAPRPVAPEMILRSFSLGSAVPATHVRIVVLENQCTGQAAFQGEQDADPANATDCRTGSPGEVGPLPGDLTPQVLTDRDDEVRIAELQVFGSAGGVAVLAPDLQVTDIKLARPNSGRPTATAVVANTGTAAAGASQTQFVFDGTRVLCLVNTPGIAAGAQVNVTCRFQRAGAQGPHTITATADHGSWLWPSSPWPSLPGGSAWTTSWRTWRLR